MSKPTVIALHVVISLLLTGMWLFGAKVTRMMNTSGSSYIAEIRRQLPLIYPDLHQILEHEQFRPVYIRYATLTNQTGFVISALEFDSSPEPKNACTLYFTRLDRSWGLFEMADLRKIQERRTSKVNSAER